MNWNEARENLKVLFLAFISIKLTIIMSMLN